ncbi:hypothetical protein MAR_033446, partial [Mya arenaria]
ISVKDLYGTSLARRRCAAHGRYHVDNVNDGAERELGRCKIRMLLDGSQKSCSECTRMYRPDSAVDIRRGMHIAVPGQYESASFKVRKYHHHAVVLAVLPSDDTSVTLEVIHVTGERDEKGNLIRKENKTYQTRDVLIIEHPEISLGDVADKALDDFEHQSDNRRFVQMCVKGSPIYIEHYMGYTEQFLSFGLLTQSICKENYMGLTDQFLSFGLLANVDTRTMKQANAILTHHIRSIHS